MDLPRATDPTADLQHIRETLDEARLYGLAPEVVYAALCHALDHAVRGVTIQECMDVGMGEWVK